MPLVDIRSLADPLLIRLHLVAQRMMAGQEAGQDPDWRNIVRVTRDELTRRGICAEDVRMFAALDAEAQRIIVAAFHLEQERERRHRCN